MSLSVHALVMLCGLAAPAFGAGLNQRRWLGLSTAAAAFGAAALWFGPGRLPDVARTGTLVALCAALQLVWPAKLPPVGAVLSGATLSGATAGVWMTGTIKKTAIRAQPQRTTQKKASVCSVLYVTTACGQY